MKIKKFPKYSKNTLKELLGDDLVNFPTISSPKSKELEDDSWYKSADEYNN